MNALRFNASALSHVGMVRKANEDAMALRPDAAFWAVADGMGGLKHGRWASQEVASALMAVSLDGDASLDVARVGEAIAAANEKIFSAAERASIQMGTTVVALYMTGSHFMALWVGDSRLYLCRSGKLVQLTRDHTQVQDLVDAGLLAPEVAKHHPNGHILSRAVGVEANLKLDVVTDQIAPRDVFLLCTDGLTCVVTDNEIAERLCENSPDIAARRLIELALARGAPDNITVIAIGCEEITQLRLELPAEVDA